VSTVVVDDVVEKMEVGVEEEEQEGSLASFFCSFFLLRRRSFSRSLVLFGISKSHSPVLLLDAVKLQTAFLFA
jgi:hypothetical protein